MRALVRRRAVRPRQHVPHSSSAQLRPRRREPSWDPGAVRLARHAARPGAGQPRRAAARALRFTPVSGRAADRGASRARRARPDLPDARASRARATGGRRGIRERGAGALHAHEAGWTSRSRRLRRGVRLRQSDWKGALERETAVPHLIFDWSPDGAVRSSPRSRRCSRPRSRGTVESALCSASRRPADLLVSAALPGLPSPSQEAWGRPAGSTLIELRPHTGRSRLRSARATSRSESAKSAFAVARHGRADPRRRDRGRDRRRSCRAPSWHAPRRFRDQRAADLVRRGRYTSAPPSPRRTSGPGVPRRTSRRLVPVRETQQVEPGAPGGDGGTGGVALGEEAGGAAAQVAAVVS
jgi:hypothetical protein